ncbi:hypothetical protein Taro_038584 [Colocasia esculenta]|uniref:Uncharacterized protein n=1 Tax=Colocasia esculenta TaxID=4460 RepID=A0A843WT43_COLES|nr:hypothetical protein [Colocasia esculenta]
MPGGCTANGTLNEANFAKPLPTIGLYVAAASFYCAAAMAVDTFLGFRSRRLWFPSKCFTLNAATLTFLAVATKLPVDLNTSMPRPVDQLSKLSSTVLICTVTGNLMPSVGVIDSPVSNIVALAILVVTVIVNVAIQMGTGVIYVHLLEHFVIVFFILVLLILFISSALPISTTKQQLEKLYDIKHNQLDVDFQKADGYDEGKLRECVAKYWVMAHTSSPQYVLGRSATCTASGAFCLLSALVLVEAFVRSFVAERSHFCEGTSDYGWSIIVVLLSQVIAIIVGTIAPALRWFTAVNYRRPDEGSRRWRDEFRVEQYWVQKLTELKEAPLSFQFRNWRCQKITHNSKNLVLGLLIKAQIGVVLCSKVVRLVSILPVCWLNHGKKLFKKLDQTPSSVTVGLVNLENFVLHLEGEDALVKLITKHERRDTKRWIQKGKKKSPKHLESLVQERIESVRGFIWVGSIDRDEVQRLALAESKHPEHCWALPVVTLASIAVALPDADQSSLKQLLSGVDEGLRYVRQIEKNLEAKGLLNQRKAADIIWSRLSLHNRWFDLDLRRLKPGPQSTRNVIQALIDIGHGGVVEFLNIKDGTDKTKTLEWPPKVLAANCMYRLCSTIQRHCDECPGMEAHLFCWLREAISDLLGACLTNLPEAIYMECFCSSIEVREESVRGAAFLLGEAEEIMSMLSDVASSYPLEKKYVDDWRDSRGSIWGWSCEHRSCSTLGSTSSNTMSGSLSSTPSLAHASNSFSADGSVTSVEFSQTQAPPDGLV